MTAPVVLITGAAGCMGRARFIEPTEVAELVYFLCQPAAAAITGADYAIDFGYTAGK